MSPYDDARRQRTTHTAHLTAANRLRTEGHAAAASILDDMAQNAHAAYQAAMAQHERDKERSRLDRITERWAGAYPRRLRLRDPREKSFIHRVPIMTEPDDTWFVENLRVPFRFEAEDGRTVFASRCPHEAIAVKLRWG